MKTSILVPSSLNSDTCVGNVGHHDMTLGQQINFGTHLFGSTSYGNNLNCAYNFTRNGSNNNSSMFALAIQYESEKCCDTLTIEGLGKYEQIYQGFQSSNLFFTFNEHLSFLLQSDPVVGGTGVNATVEHIDCSCPPSQLLVKNGLLTSPGYSTSLSYCPGIYCYPDIAFQDDLYDLQLVVEDIDLRTYTIYNTTDYVEIVNSYNHQIVQMLPGYVGFDKFWATVSPVTVNFWANYASAIPMNMAGRGFSINLNLVKKDYAKEKVVFNDNNFLKDISKLDLASGKTFEFIVEARKGKQIYIYFFTKIATQVFVDIFDGDSMDAKRIDNKALYSNIQENGDSYFLRTSGEKAVIHIRGNPEFLQPGTDFQAMITDVDVDSCGPLVHSLKSENSYSGVKLQGTNCYKILHFSDSSYSQTAFMNIWISKSIDITVYLGLNTSMPIAQYASDTLPQYLFTNYLVLKYSTTDMVSLHYNWGISSGIVARTMEANETVIIMSADYGKANSSPLVQQFSVQLEGESNVQTGLSVQFLDSSGKGSSDITWLKYNDKITEKSLPPFQKTQNFASCGNKLLVDYTSPGGGSDNGLHLKITQADLRCSASSMVLVLPHLPIMLIILLKFSSILF
uniref:Uncharacterized protein n=1 Tax=Caenorhabditis japonica TaxID=281687 RepID=A0A8R1I309_CAEJA